LGIEMAARRAPSLGTSSPRIGYQSSVLAG
jgi:hypothetical protein